MKKIQSLPLKIIESPWFYPLALLVIGISAYGLMIPSLGFYWDDWEGVYLYNLHNPAISFQYYAERPASALAYLVLFPLAKMTPVVWHVVTLILRWAGVLFVYYTLNALWPKRVWQNRWIGVLLFVFPGFLVQPVSVAFSQHLFTFVLFSASLFLTVLALKSHKLFWLWMPLSVVLGITQIFMMEYFVGLEILRPLVIGFILASEEKNKKRILWKTICYWLPFIIGLVVYAWWRFIYLPGTFTGPDPNNPIILKTFLSAPVTVLGPLLKKIYQDVGYLIITVWGNAFSAELFQLKSITMWGSWFIGIAMGVLFGWYVHRISSFEELNKTDLLQLCIFGCLTLVAGAAPVWATGRQVADGKWSDRFAISPMLGAAILLVCLLDWLVKTRNQKNWLMAILLASSIVSQIYNDNTFRKDWTAQRNLYWQLSWRIPDLKPGTAIIGSGTFTDKSSFYDGNYIVNLIFEKKVGESANYGYFDIWHLPLDSYQPDLPLISVMRYGQFEGNTSQAIGMYFNNKSNECVRVLDTIYTGDPNFNEGISSIIPISNLSQILVDETTRTPDPDLFGTEPAHQWCYYFEKADLARQKKDWNTILQLWSEAGSNGFGSPWGSEYLSFIEAFAQTGQWSQALDLSLIVKDNDTEMVPVLCNNWNRFSEINGGQVKDSYLDRAKSEFCPTDPK
jgi:hypothetical protein